MLLHCLILYVPPAASVFSVVPLSGAEWGAIFWLSFPVILVDELLKYLTRCACMAFWPIMMLPGVGKSPPTLVPCAGGAWNAHWHEMPMEQCGDGLSWRLPNKAGTVWAAWAAGARAWA